MCDFIRRLLSTQTQSKRNSNCKCINTIRYNHTWGKHLIGWKSINSLPNTCEGRRPALRCLWWSLGGNEAFLWVLYWIIFLIWCGSCIRQHLQQKGIRTNPQNKRGMLMFYLNTHWFSHIVSKICVWMSSVEEERFIEDSEFDDDEGQQVVTAPV